MKILYLYVAVLSVCIIMFIPSSIFAQDNHVLIKLKEPFAIKVNQIAVMTSDDVQITLTNIAEDSRCPIGVECIWQGQVSLYLNLVKNNKDIGNFTLTSRSGDKELMSQVIDGYNISVVKVEPYPIKGQKLSLSDYVATLEITNSDTQPPLNQTIPEFPLAFLVFLASTFLVIFFHRIKNYNIFY